VLFLGREQYRHRLGMDRRDDRIRRSDQEAVDEVGTRNRLGLGPPVAVELCPDAGERAQRPVVVQREPDDVLLLGFRVRLWRIFSEAVERNKATVLGLEPNAPMRRRGVPDVGDRRPARPWRR